MDWPTARTLLSSAFHRPLESLPASLSAVPSWYAATDPLVSAAWGCVALMAECWLASVATNDFSQVDRQWSLTPFIYAWHFALHSNPALLSGQFSNPRTVLIAILATLWGLRLTFNFWRKGGYSGGLLRGEEDYRWVVMKKQIPMPLFHIFNIVFIATTQHALLLAIVLPSYLALLSGFTGWTFLDLIATVTFLFLLTVETLADEEQWRFQSKKYAVRGGSLKLGANDPDAEDINRGFLTRGLFRYSRHPNFWAEQSMWWTIYLFSVAATGEWQNWTMGGTIALTALFQGSTWMTEGLSAGKYPEYKVYQKRVSRFLPLPPDETIPWKSDKGK